MRYQLGPYSFASKAEAKDLFKDFLDKYRGDIPIDSEAHQALLEVIAIHPDQEQKVGRGIKNFYVALDPRFHKNYCFNLMRVDGSYTEFSPAKVIDGPVSYRSKFMSAGRRAIAPDIIAFKARYFRDRIHPVCELLGTPLSLKTAHVDHMPPHTFSRIAELFMGLQDIQATFLKAIDNECGYTFNSKAYSDHFRSYHLQYVTRYQSLRVISAEANLKRLDR